MPTVEDMRRPAALARQCPHCDQRIVWATAYLGAKLPFDPEPVPRKADPTGWVAGRFDIDGTLRTAYAPLPLHPLVRRRTATHVMRLHSCRDAA